MQEGAGHKLAAAAAGQEAAAGQVESIRHDRTGAVRRVGGRGTGARVPAVLHRPPASTRSTRSSGSCATPSSATKRARSSSSSASVEMPKPWSQQATNIVVSKYFRGHVGSPDREHSVRQLIGRVVDTITEWARRQDYFASADGARRRSATT